MPNDAQKIWLAKSLGTLANNKTADHGQNQPKAMPCTVVKVVGSHVTIKFEVTSNFTLPQITIPQAMSDYARVPTQVGDKGYAVPNDFYLGGQSGIGGGTANLTPKGNLSTLVFHHVSQSSFTPVDQNAYVIHGPNGAVIKSTDGSTVITVTPGGTVHIKGNLQVEGSIIAGYGTGDQVGLQTHIHAGGPPPDPGT